MDPSNIQRLMVAVAVLSSLFAITSGDADAKVKECPFDSVYSLGIKDSSPGYHGVVDQLAAAFHLPSPNVYTEDGPLPYGATFATENAMALSKYFLDKRGIQVPSDSSADSITSQLFSFANYLDPMCSHRLACRQKFRRAFFMVDLVSNDYKYPLLNGKSLQEVEQYKENIVNNIGDLLKEIRKVGMSKILVPGMLPLGCLPGYLSLLHNVNPAEFDVDNCHTGLNDMARNHNNQLRHTISVAQSLGSYSQSKTLVEVGEIPSDSEILYADYYNAFMALLRENSGTNQRALLFREDGFHLTEAANKFIVGKLLSGNNFVEPEIHLQLPYVNHCVV